MIRPDPSETATRTAGDTGSPITVAKAIAARWVVSVTYQHLGDRLRITVRITDVETASVVGWRFDGTVDELFSLQDQFVTQLRESLKSSRDDGALVQAVAPQGSWTVV